MRALIATALRDHFSHPVSVCSHGDPRKDAIDHTQTITSSIVDLTTGEYYITLGPPCESEYRPLPWNLYDETTPEHEEDAQAIAQSLAALVTTD
jgi:isopenicillin-N N-acyltransferase-like protein